jgi:hypothetical protein
MVGCAELALELVLIRMILLSTAYMGVEMSIFKLACYN